MNESLLFNGFIIVIIPYIIISILVLTVLKKEGYNYSILNTTLSNYGSLRKLVKEQRKYKWLYLAYLISTFLPLSIFILFIVLVFT